MDSGGEKHGVLVFGDGLEPAIVMTGIRLCRYLS